MKRVHKLLGLWAVLFTAAAQAAQPVYYVVAHAGPGESFWAVMHKGAMDAGKTLGATVHFVAPEQSGDLAKQLILLRAAIAANPAGIATTITNNKAFVDPIKKALGKGIPVIVYDTREDPRDPITLPYDSYIGADDYKAGIRVGQRALRTLKKGDRAVIANHSPGHSGLELRSSGIEKELKAAGVEVDKLDIAGSSTKGIAVLNSYLKRVGKIQALFGLGSNGTAVGNKFLEEQGLAGQVLFASFDLDSVAVKAIEENKLEYTLDQMPYYQSYMVVTQLHMAHTKQFTPIDMDFGGGFVDRSNVAQVKELVKAGVR
jgi:simple sugar transport system substrate-binding protein